MRIVAGKYKSRTIATPEGRNTRPTTDRVREALFSAIWARLGNFDGLHALDTFAGSGALGIEALSRGCLSCTFFEKDRRAQKIIQANFEALNIPFSQTKLYKQDVLIFLESAAKRGSDNTFAHSFDLVLVDPPYALESLEVCSLCENLATLNALSQNALIAYEHAIDNTKNAQEAFSQLSHFQIIGTKEYGKIAVLFLRYGF